VVGLPAVQDQRIYGEYKTTYLAQRIADWMNSRLERAMCEPSSAINGGWVHGLWVSAERRCMTSNERYAYDLGFQAERKFQSTNSKARRLGYAEIAMEFCEFREWYFEKVRDVKACEWCSDPFGSGARKGGHVHHDHVTGECHFICRACNNIEGKARSPERLGVIASAMRGGSRASERPALARPTAMTKANIIARVCEALSSGSHEQAANIASTEYPFVALAKAERRYTEIEMMRVFVRDGFIDRYSGQRLLFPGTLRLLSQLMPAHFPAHKNWKMSESHIVFWELFPTIDHLVPVARGGADEEANWVTTSMLRNSAKAQWTLDELGWELRKPGSLDKWDGLTSWFLEHTAAHPEVVSSGYLKRWRSAATTTRPG